MSREDAPDRVMNRHLPDGRRWQRTSRRRARQHVCQTATVETDPHDLGLAAARSIEYSILKDQHHGNHREV
jgi:hypothetical protein